MHALAEAAIPRDLRPAARAAPAWRDLRIRLISAGLLAPLGLGGLLNGGWLFTALVLLAMAGIGLEAAALSRLRSGSAARLMLLAWPGLSLLAAVGVDWLTGLRLLLGGFLLGPARGGAVVLIGLGGFALIWLRDMTGTGAASLLFVVLAVWASDSLAYLVGRAVGGAKLAPRVSPGKTWSGALGGLLGAMLAGAAVALLVRGHQLQPWDAGWTGRLPRGVLFGALLGVAAQAGDLAESVLKRRCGVKDSGRLIPGHGGLLDRLDGLMAAAPLAVLFSFGCAPGQPFWQLEPLHPRAIDLDARHIPPGWLEGLVIPRTAPARDRQP